jgi:hypothetical protein
MKTAIARIKELAAKSGRQNLPISVTHTDLPTNDWTTLFQTVLFSHDSYLVGERDVFCFGSGNSIYEQIFPPNHIAFGYSAITEHWLSRKLPLSLDHFEEFARPAVYFEQFQRDGNARLSLKRTLGFLMRRLNRVSSLV